MLIGVQTAPWFDHDDPRGSLEFIRDCGFDALDLNLDKYFDTKAAAAGSDAPSVLEGMPEQVFARFAGLEAALGETGLTVCQAHAPFPVWFPGQDALNARILGALENCLALCEKLGCPAIVVHPVVGPDPQTERARNLALYRSLMPAMNKYPGVTVCLENLMVHPDGPYRAGPCSNAGEVCSLLDQLNRELGRDQFGFCFDLGHANLARLDIRKYLQALGHRVTLLHIHDNNGISDQHMLPYSCMFRDNVHVTDWSGFLTALREIGYRGPLNFEVFRVYRSFPPAVHREAYRLVSAIGRHWAEELKK